MHLRSRWRYHLARLFMMLKRPERAAVELRAALAEDPSFALASRSLAFLYASTGQPQAIDQFHAALALEPDDAPTHFNLGFVHHERGEFGPAVSAFDRALALDRNLDRAWYGKGLALRSMGELEAAAESLHRAGKIQPMNSLAWYELGMTYYALKKYDKLHEVLEHLNGFDPKMTMQLMRETPERVSSSR
jgi:tetratricopeptide (TPR) repeat protein